MEDILEIILTILFMPFEEKYENMYYKINRISNKALKGFLKVLLILTPLSIIFGVCCPLSYIIRGYWI